MGRIRVYGNQGTMGGRPVVEPIQETLIPFINDIIGNEWEMEFREWFTIENLTTVDVHLEAKSITLSQFSQIQDLVTERMSMGYEILGRDIEYNGVEYALIFHYGIIHFSIPDLNFIPESLRESLPLELLYAAIFE
jgi:hypothetical protein